MSTLHITSATLLNNDVAMPVFGLGTFQSEKGKTTQQAVLWALEAGYRHIDTAAIYGNEADVGQAIQESGVPRQQIFVTTKVWNGDQGFSTTLRAYDESLKRLQMNYVDLYLIHWPIKDTRAEAWKALVRLYEEKRVRAIGVSNYTVPHLEEILASSPVIPAVNQFELSPFLTRQSLVRFCQAHHIQVESYSPLARGRKWEEPTILRIAQQKGKTPAQIMLRWALEKGYVVIPKSVHRERIVENAGVFDFSFTDAEVNKLDELNSNYRTVNPPWMHGEWNE